MDVEENGMGGLTVLIEYEEDLDEVPESHRHLLRAEELAALRNPARYFSRLARGAKPLSFRRWLQELSRCDVRPVLELHTGGLPGVQSDAFLRFFLLGGASPAVRLRSGALLRNLPPALAEVYDLIDGTNHDGFDRAGGLWRAKGLGRYPVSQTGAWFAEDKPLDPDAFFAFYDDGSGDMLCYAPDDRAAWYKHEIGMLEETDPLPVMVGRYFYELLQGRKLGPRY
jgi:hypothetical protein